MHTDKEHYECYTVLCKNVLHTDGGEDSPMHANLVLYTLHVTNCKTFVFYKHGDNNDSESCGMKINLSQANHQNHKYQVFHINSSLLMMVKCTGLTYIVFKEG